MKSNMVTTLAGILLLASNTVYAAAIHRDFSANGAGALRLRDGAAAPPSCPAAPLDTADGVAVTQEEDAAAGSNTFIEDIEGENDDCIGPVPNDGGERRRSLNFESRLARRDNSLEKRGRARNVKACIYGAPANGASLGPGTAFNLVIPAYPKATPLAAEPGKGFIAPKNPNTCGGDAGLAITPTGPPSAVVVEHVFEGQSMKLYVEDMTSGTLADGSQLPGGRAPVDPTLFTANWPAAVGNTAFGASPALTYMGLLGHEAADPFPVDHSNLQVFDATLNGMKANVNGRKSIIGTSNYQGMTAAQKMNSLGQIQNVFAYMALPQTIASYNGVYRGAIKLWEEFGTVPGAQPAAPAPSYDYAAAFGAAVKADLTAQITKTKVLYLTFIDDLIVYFNGPASDQEDITLKTLALQTLPTLKAAADTAIAYNVAALTALT